MIEEKKTINKDMKPTYKGIKIVTVIRIGAVIGIILIGIVLCNLYGIAKKYDKLAGNVNSFIESHDYIVELKSASDYMTEQSRMYVLTGETVYMQKYFKIVDDKSREQSFYDLKEVLDSHRYEKVIKSIQKTLRESDALMDYEIHAMKLIASMKTKKNDTMAKQVKEYSLSEDERKFSDAQKQKKAYDLVYGKEYCQDKATIISSIQNVFGNLSQRIKVDTIESVSKLRPIINRLICAVVFLFILLVVVSVAIVYLIVRPLKVFAGCIEGDRKFDVIGACEFRYLARTYNNVLELNQENKARMKFKMDHDALTQVYNRHAFEEQKALLAKEGIPVAMLMIDVDKFKEVNDNYGHEMGDQTLIHVAELLRRTFNGDDIIARIGGDEFAVIIKNVTKQDIGTIGKKIDEINAILQTPMDGEVKTSLSIGLAFSEEGYTEELSRKADAALYVTKESGRCGYHVK